MYFPINFHIVRIVLLLVFINIVVVFSCVIICYCCRALFVSFFDQQCPSTIYAMNAFNALRIWCLNEQCTIKSEQPKPKPKITYLIYDIIRNIQNTKQPMHNLNPLLFELDPNKWKVRFSIRISHTLNVQYTIYTVPAANSQQPTNRMCKLFTKTFHEIVRKSNGFRCLLLCQKFYLIKFSYSRKFAPKLSSLMSFASSRRFINYYQRDRKNRQNCLEMFCYKQGKSTRNNYENGEQKYVTLFRFHPFDLNHWIKRKITDDLKITIYSERRRGILTCCLVFHDLRFNILEPFLQKCW